MISLFNNKERRTKASRSLIIFSIFQLKIAANRLLIFISEDRQLVYSYGISWRIVVESLTTNRVINTHASLSFNVRRDSPVSFLSTRVNLSCIYISYIYIRYFA